MVPEASDTAAGSCPEAGRYSGGAEWAVSRGPWGAAHGSHFPATHSSVRIIAKNFVSSEYVRLSHMGGTTFSRRQLGSLHFAARG